MKKILLALALFVSLSANSQCRITNIAGMFAADKEPVLSYPGNNSITSASIGDSVVFVVSFDYGDCSDDRIIYTALNGTNFQALSLADAKKYRICNAGTSPCDGKPYSSGLYKIGFKVLTMTTGVKTVTFSPSINPLSINVLITESVTASIKDALSVNKQGIINVYDISGKLLKTGDLSNYKEGLESGKLYLYKVFYLDNTYASGKLIFE